MKKRFSEEQIIGILREGTNPKNEVPIFDDGDVAREQLDFFTIQRKHRTEEV